MGPEIRWIAGSTLAVAVAVALIAVLSDGPASPLLVVGVCAAVLLVVVAIGSVIYLRSPQGRAARRRPPD